jgi:3-oxoacyl-[acyl-carrier-protein] synthase-3
MLIMGSVTGEMRCPSTACRVAAEIGAVGAAAFDVLAACCGFVYSLNLAHEMIRGGAYRTIAVVGCDCLSTIVDYTNRNVCIIFGDAAGAVILKATDDTTKGILAQSMHADGSGWKDLYLPEVPADIPVGVDPGPVMLSTLQMNGREVYKFAVGTFPELMLEVLAKAGLKPEDVDQYVCHQSNARILESARERLGLPADKVYVNIDRIGNTSAGSVPLCFDELRRAGKIRDGQKIMFVAFGGGLTWGSAVLRWADLSSR